MTEQQEAYPIASQRVRVQQAKNGKHFIEITPRSELYDKMDATGGVVVGGRRYQTEGYGEEYRTRDGWRIRAYLSPQKEPGAVTITKRSSMRSVDAYATGSIIRHEGQWMVVDGYSRQQDDQGAYLHILDLRPATEAEQQQGRISEVRSEMRAMGPGPDDERTRPAHQERLEALDDELRRLEGRLSREEEKAAANRVAEERVAELRSGPIGDRIRAAVEDHTERHRQSISMVADAVGIPHLSDFWWEDRQPTAEEIKQLESFLGVSLS